MLQVGQQLWYVPNDSRRGEARFVTVTQVGRKWAQIGPTSRISIETLAVDAGRLSSPGRCYLTREAWETQTRVNKLWDTFRRRIDAMYGPSKHLDEGRIREAARILDIDIG